MFKTHLDKEPSDMKSSDWRMWVLSGLAAIAVSCCQGNAGGGGVRAPFTPAGKTTVFQYETTPVGQSPTTLTVRYVGETTFNGQTVEHCQGTYAVSAGTKTADVYGWDHGGGRIELAGFSVTYPAGSGTDYTVTFDEVVSLDEAAIPVGVEQTKTISGLIQFGSAPPVSGSGHV